MIKSISNLFGSRLVGGKGPVKLSLLVSQCVTVSVASNTFSKKDFFLKFYVKVVAPNCSKMSFLAFFKKRKEIIYSFTVKMVHSNVVYDYARTCLGKICFLSLALKLSQPIRMQYSLIINISGRNHLIS